MQAISEMRLNHVSTAYAVDNKMKLLGIITIDDAVQAKKWRRSIVNFYTE